MRVRRRYINEKSYFSITCIDNVCFCFFSSKFQRYYCKDSNKENANYQYTISGNNVEIKKYIGKGTDVSILSKIDNKKVTSILALILLPIGISMAESNLHLDKLPFDISYIWLGSAIERLAVGTPSTGVMIPCTISILAYIVVIYFITMASVKKIEV